MILRAALLALTLLAPVAAANAASVSITTDKSVYAPGEMIQLTVTADPEGDLLQGLLIGVTYDPALLSNGPDAVQGTYLNGTPVPVSPTNSPGTYTTHAAIISLIVPSDPGVVVSTGSLIAEGIGVATLGIGMNTPGETFSFGSASPVPNALTVIIPEPTTAALLGLGLVGLAGTRRRHSA